MKQITDLMPQEEKDEVVGKLKGMVKSVWKSKTGSGCSPCLWMTVTTRWICSTTMPIT